MGLESLIFTGVTQSIVEFFKRGWRDGMQDPPKWAQGIMGAAGLVIFFAYPILFWVMPGCLEVERVWGTAQDVQNWITAINIVCMVTMAAIASLAMLFLRYRFFPRRTR